MVVLKDVQTFRKEGIETRNDIMAGVEAESGFNSIWVIVKLPGTSITVLTSTGRRDISM